MSLTPNLDMIALWAIPSNPNEADDIDFQDGEINSFPRQKLRAYQRKAVFLCSHLTLQFTTLYELSKLRNEGGDSNRKNQISGDFGSPPPPKKNVFCGASSYTYSSPPSTFLLRWLIEQYLPLGTLPSSPISFILSIFNWGHNTLEGWSKWKYSTMPSLVSLASS